jgi:hypothetical protein
MLVGKASCLVLDTTATPESPRYRICGDEEPLATCNELQLYAFIVLDRKLERGVVRLELPRIQLSNQHAAALVATSLPSGRCKRHDKTMLDKAIDCLFILEQLVSNGLLPQGHEEIL